MSKAVEKPALQALEELLAETESSVPSAMASAVSAHGVDILIDRQVHDWHVERRRYRTVDGHFRYCLNAQRGAPPLLEGCAVRLRVGTSERRTRWRRFGDWVEAEVVIPSQDHPEKLLPTVAIELLGSADPNHTAIAGPKIASSPETEAAMAEVSASNIKSTQDWRILDARGRATGGSGTRARHASPAKATTWANLCDSPVVLPP